MKELIVGEKKEEYSWSFLTRTWKFGRKLYKRKSVFNRNWIRVQEFIFSNTQAKYKSLKISVRSSKGIKLLVLST